MVNNNLKMIQVIVFVLLFSSVAGFSQKTDTTYHYNPDGTLDRIYYDTYIGNDKYYEMIEFHPNGNKEHLRIWHLYEDSSGSYFSRDSFEIYWFQNGQKSAQLEFDNGVPNGTWISWWRNGQVKEVDYWRNGKIYGESFNFYKNGELMSVKVYDENQLIKYVHYFDTGELQATGEFDKDGGILYDFYKNGTMHQLFYYDRTDHFPGGEIMTKTFLLTGPEFYLTDPETKEKRYFKEGEYMIWTRVDNNRDKWEYFTKNGEKYWEKIIYSADRIEEKRIK